MELLNEASLRKMYIFVVVFFLQNLNSIYVSVN